MRFRKLRNRFAVASSISAAAVAAALIVAPGVASAAPPTTPAFPTLGTYPSWLPSTGQISNVDHSEGSDTTLFAMQAISNTYMDAGLFPFSCQPTTNNQNCVTPAGNGGVNPNNTQSDTTDNFAATEELQGVNDVGSGNGQGELCGTVGTPVGTTVDYARSSKPFGVAACAGQQLGFAKDSVIPVDFQGINPHLYGTPTGYVGTSFTSFNASGTAVVTPFPAGGIGPVAAGWLPGDPFTCSPGGTPCSGTPFSDVDNTALSGGLPATSLAYRLWCQHGTSATANESQITDWGQLTNLTGSEVPGQGAPIGVPIRIIGVNAGSGTAATFFNFAKSGLGSGNCTATTNYNENAASQGNPQTSQGPAPGNLEIALENDAAQIGDFASANWPATDAADQAVDIATSLYFMGLGAYNSNPAAPVAVLEATGVPAGDPTAFTATQMKANTKSATIATERNNTFPTSRTLFNIFRTDSVRASTAGFLNWLCDTNPANGGTIQKGQDHIDGLNFDTDLSNIINGQFGLSRLTDATPELAAASQVTANGITNPNGSCEAIQNIGAGGITNGNATITLTGTVPSTIQVGWGVSIPTGFSSALPANTTVASISGNTITLNNAPVSGTGGTAPSTLYFPGHPPVLAVTNASS